MVGVPRGEFFTTDYTDGTDFLFFFSREFALFAVDFSSTMRNPKEPKTCFIRIFSINSGK